MLFSGAMVRAILEGRKRQTRRMVKHPADANGFISFSDGPLNVNDPECAESCPYGQPGDGLWVRETWLRWACPLHDEGYPPDTKCDCTEPSSIRYRADGEIPAVRWKPSIFLPRWASRLTLEIESVRVERLQDISEEDAKAEGVEQQALTLNGDAQMDRECRETPREAFARLWRSINGPESWDANPWVWVIGFKRVEVAP